MEIFYIIIILLGILTVIGSLFFIAMDKANGKDFFKEFDRKKDEMYNLVQESDEMIQELNKMSDYVVSMITEKNKEFFEKISNTDIDKPDSSGESTESLNGNENKLNSSNVTYSPPMTVRVKPNVKVSPYNQQTSEEKSNEIPENNDAVNNELQTTGEDIVYNKLSEDIESHKESLSVDLETDMQNKKSIEAIEDKSSASAAFDDSDIFKSKLYLNLKRQEVLNLIREGLSDDEIANKLKIGKGEIRLIRGLSK